MVYENMRFTDWQNAEHASNFTNQNNTQNSRGCILKFSKCNTQGQLGSGVFAGTRHKILIAKYSRWENASKCTN